MLLSMKIDYIHYILLKVWWVSFRVYWMQFQASKINGRWILNISQHEDPHENKCTICVPSDICLSRATDTHLHWCCWETFGYAIKFSIFLSSWVLFLVRESLDLLGGFIALLQLFLGSGSQDGCIYCLEGKMVNIQFFLISRFSNWQ
jgi:hypothetical protein